MRFGADNPSGLDCPSAFLKEPSKPSAWAEVLALLRRRQCAIAPTDLLNYNPGVFLLSPPSIIENSPPVCPWLCFFLIYVLKLCLSGPWSGNRSESKEALDTQGQRFRRSAPCSISPG